jgi:N-acetylneuraminate synthase/N,N'-diacetyllegionaminate synthase
MTIRIDKRSIGPTNPCFVIAEAGVNHNGDLEMARQLVEVAAQAGADAVKFQTFHADELASANAPKAAYQKCAGSADESQRDMLRRLELSPRDHMELMALCKTRGILFLSSPFDDSSADMLCQMGLLALKIPSGEITNLPFLAHVAAMKLPLVISTGMANMKEVDDAIRTVRNSGSPPIALLHCVSAYPAQAGDCNLRAMISMQKRFRVPVGFSDHTLGPEVALAAVALGANVIEKHITLEKSLPGPDHRASMAPDEFRDLVRQIRAIESALGSGRKEPVESERETALVARKSLVAVADIPAGTTITAAMLTTRRPGSGISPTDLTRVLGRSSKAAICSETMLEWGMFE